MPMYVTHLLEYSIGGVTVVVTGHMGVKVCTFRCGELRRMDLTVEPTGTGRRFHCTTASHDDDYLSHHIWAELRARHARQPGRGL